MLSLQSSGIQASTIVLPPQPNLHLVDHNGCPSPGHHSPLPDEGRRERRTGVEDRGRGRSVLSFEVTIWKLHISFMLTSYCLPHSQMVTSSFKDGWEMQF